MKPKPPLPEKALKLGKNIIIADVHLGYEIAMAKEGSTSPPGFSTTL